MNVIQKTKDRSVPFEKMDGFKFDKVHSSYNKILKNIISYLNMQVVELTMDMHGNHVIQSLLMVFKASERPQDDDNLGSHQTS